VESGGMPGPDELKESDVKARVFGDTGVVTGLLHIKGMSGARGISGDYRRARVYTKKGGEWLALVEQRTYVFPPEKPKDGDKKTDK
jgi:ketosteroid isomerase-like protein